MATIRSLFWHKYLAIKVFGVDFSGAKQDITREIAKLNYLMLEVDYDPAMLNLQAPPMPAVLPTVPPKSTWHNGITPIPIPQAPLLPAPKFSSPKGSFPASSDFERGARAMQDAIMNEKQNALARGQLQLEDFRISSIDIPKDTG